MRLRISMLVTLLLMLAVTACSGSPLGRAATPTPRPVKTLRPTFTPSTGAKGVTIAATSTRRATLTPTATVPATATVPPTATTEPSPTPKAAEAKLTVANATLNVRGGPGTNYPVLGQVRQGQEFPITGKSPAGDWWQFDFEGQPGWVLGTMVTVNEAAASVEVAANIPEAPTAAPRPTSAPRPPTQPPAPPAPATQFSANGLDYRPPNQNPVITVYCRVWNQKRTGFVAGTLRVSGPGGDKRGSLHEHPGGPLLPGHAL